MSEPATGETLAEVGKALPADVEAAVTRATDAQKAWIAASPVERSEVFLKAAVLMDEHRDEFTEWLIREIGSTRGKAGFEIEFAKDELVNASALPFEAQGVILPDVEDRTSYARREPYGVCGIITPFNVPLILAARAIAPALAIGNAVLHKPNGLAAVCGGILFARALQEAGLPDGVLQVITGDGVGEALVAHPAVKMIHFTGFNSGGPLHRRKWRPEPQEGVAEYGRQERLSGSRRRGPRSSRRQRSLRRVLLRRPVVYVARSPYRPQIAIRPLRRANRRTGGPPHCRGPLADGH